MVQRLLRHVGKNQRRMKGELILKNLEGGGGEVKLILPALRQELA